MKLGLRNYIYNQITSISQSALSKLGKTTSEFGFTIPCLLEKICISSTSARETCH